MPEDTVVWTLDNIGYAGQGRFFEGFCKKDGRQSWLVEPREIRLIALKEGDLLHVDARAGAEAAALCAFLPDGRDGLAQCGLSATEALDRAALNTQELEAWIAAHGGDPSSAVPVARLPAQNGPVFLKAAGPVTVWLANPLGRTALAEGRSAGTIQVERQRHGQGRDVPDPLADLADEIFVPRGSARAYELRAGQKVQIIDLEGQQCSDFQALSAAALDRQTEHLIDTTATRSMVRHAYPRPGLLNKFYNLDMQPMLRVLRDTCGRHDSFSLACTARGYEDRGFPGHLNCSDNISNALAPYGVAPRLAWPAINLFWNTWLDDHHQVLTEESWSRAGDYVVMEAMQDLVCVSTACPDDIDPINGWNPTDILVRIYNENQKITRAVGYREREDSPMLVSQESAFHERLAPLTKHFASARDLWSPVSFPSHGTLGEYQACREAVTVQDMGGLRKFDVIGPDAERLLQLATTRDVTKLSQWRGQYTLLCDDTGSLIDDGTLFRLAPDIFRWCCGSEESGRVLQALAEDRGLQVRINAMRNALPNLAVQGPNSRELLRRICFTQPTVPSLEQLKWFGVTVARLHDRDGAPFMVSRSGYTGELGYEIFCGKADALDVWDAVMDAGEDLGITPMGSAALEIIRIEAGLAAANAEFAPNVNAFEAGLGFAVDLRKPEFVGREALQRAKDTPARVLKGLLLENGDVPAHGAAVFKGERPVGVITSATRSPALGHSIALARLAIEHSENETELEIGQLDGRMKRLAAHVTNPAFVDPQRKRARA